MARLVRCDAQKPHVMEVGGEKHFIRMCGLAQTKPFCDGTHKKTRDEEPGKVYSYGGDGSRVEVAAS